MRKIERAYLAAAALALCAAVTLSLFGARTVRADNDAQKLQAAETLSRCMEQVKRYKQERGLALSAEDWFSTGMIGDAYSGMTTTLGPIEAKRTTANPDMAALVVQLLTQAGLRAGDTVGAGFSGSFPAMNLAVLAACDAMGLRVIYISSAGASTYGANQPELTFPDMAYMLVQDGLLSTQGAAVSMGGASDCGLDMDAQTRAELMERFASYAVPFLYEEDYAENLAARRSLYEGSGGIDCFVGVGGNMTTQGRGGAQVGWGVSAPHSVKYVDGASGLLDIYNDMGIPTVNLLNIKQLVAEYGLEYDPSALPAIGESAVYYAKVYSLPVAAAGLLAAAVILIFGAKRFQKRAQT